jgi:outer membrane immunogenic protein
MRHKGFLLATAAGSAAAASGGAQAADLAYKAAVMPPPAASWEGWYIGLHAGAAWQQGHANGHTYQESLSQTSNTGFIGGAQIGHNWQHGNFVYGWEADISGLTGEGRTTGDKAASLTQKMNWLSTVRGRAGLAVGDTMAYVTGGIAFGKVSNTLDTGCPGCIPNIKSESKTRVGWTIGGGIEHMLDRNWTIGFEGLWVDLGHKKIVNSSGTDTSKTTTFSNQAVIGRVKLNYKW